MHIRTDKNEPFYIGIGSSIKRAYKKDGRNNLWEKIVKKTSYNVKILFNGISRKEACEKEREFIKLYGRICDNTGCLSNITVGGDILLGKDNPMYGVGEKVEIDGVKYNCIAEAARLLCKNEKTISYRLKSLGFPNYIRLSNDLSGKRLSNEELSIFFKEKNSGENNPMYGKNHTQDTKDKISKINKGKKRSENFIEKSTFSAKNKVGVILEKEDVSITFISKSAASRYIGVNLSSVVRAISKNKTCKGYRIILKDK
jgi:hypothetical protein